MRRSVPLFAAIALFLSACSGQSGTTGTSSGFSGLASGFDPRDLTFSARLVPFDACDAVLAHFKAEALERVGPYGLGGGPYWYGPMFGGAVAEDSGRTDSGGPPVPTTGPVGGDGGDDSFSGTNVQVAGVDEPDIVKNDGERIVAITDGVVRYFDVTGDEPVLRDSLRLESGWGHRFFISGDRAFVFSQGDVWAIPMFAADAARIAPGGYGSPVSIVQEVDLSDPDELHVVRTVRFDGTYLSARAVGDTVRLVVSSYPHQLPFVYPSNPGAEDFAEEANRQVIQDSTIETWLPGYTVYDASGDEAGQGLLVECSRMHRPEEFAGFDTLSVTTLDLGSGLDVGDGTGVIAQGQTVYASPQSLYVSTNVFIPDDAWERFPGDMVELEQTYETAIHKFDIAGTGPARYLASGSVSGHLLNQFALDDHEGFLRVATTTGTPWGGEDSESQVVVLAERDGTLNEVGRVGDLGKGERI
ncbi:MAG TPA: beta-propeller domain-containing protein, partial [Acidimicrobiia bacterium]|nr:beta-propeller domain-containing protein [Acidimicrobiia bacterium]